MRILEKIDDAVGAHGKHACPHHQCILRHTVVQKSIRLMYIILDMCANQENMVGLAAASAAQRTEDSARLI